MSAWLGAVLGWSSAAVGQSELVRVTCPQLSPEQAAEIEARVRTSLLTTDAQVSVEVSCDAENASVKIASRSGAVALETLAMSANLREELLGALDRAFEKLDQPATETEVPALPSAASEQPVAVAAPRPSARPAGGGAPQPQVKRGRGGGAFVRASSAPLIAAAVVERWSSRLGWGAELGSEWPVASLRYGIRAVVVTPVASERTFTLFDWQGMAHIAARPRGWANLQVTLGAGLGWMVVSPRGAATSREVSIVRAPFALLALSRSTRFGHFAVVPELGARLFASERGVKVDQRESVVFGWLVPRLALGITYLPD